MVHTLVRLGTDPGWGSPVHETLTEVNTVRGNIGGTNIHRHVSITPGCLKQEDLREDGPHIQLVRRTVKHPLRLRDNSVRGRRHSASVQECFCRCKVESG